MVVILSARTKAKIYGVEIQEDIYKLGLDSILYNKYKSESIKLDEESADYIIYNSEGEQTEFMNLKMGDVLSVKSSRNTDTKQIEIYISGKEKVTDKVNLINREEMKLKVGETEYKMTSEFYDYMNNSGKSLILGGEYVFHFDVFGNIVFGAIFKFDVFACNKNIKLFQTFCILLQIAV